MPTVQQLMEWMRSGEGRLIAAGVLYILMWLLKAHVPVVDKWLDTSSGKLTTKRKKLLANVVLAMTPVAVVLTDPEQSIGEALTVAVQVALSAGGIQGFGKALLHKPDAETPDKESGDDGEAEAGEGDSESEKSDADDTRRTTPATGDES